MIQEKGMIYLQILNHTHIYIYNSLPPSLYYLYTRHDREVRLDACGAGWKIGPQRAHRQIDEGHGWINPERWRFQHFSTPSEVGMWNDVNHNIDW